MTTFEHRRLFLRDLAYIAEQMMAFHAYHGSAAPHMLEPYRDRRIVENALLESSLSFLRKANEFFGGKKEIAASHYIEGWKDEWLLENNDREILNDRVMHISLKEVTDGKFSWGDFMLRNLPRAFERYHAFVHALYRKAPEYFDPTTKAQVEDSLNFIAIYLRVFDTNTAILRWEHSLERKP